VPFKHAFREWSTKGDAFMEWSTKGSLKRIRLSGSSGDDQSTSGSPLIVFSSPASPQKRKEGGNMENEAAIYIRNVPTGLRDMYSAALRRRGSNMSEDIREHMKKVVKEEGLHIQKRRQRPRRKTA
jgi:hypothetical protein